MWTNLFNGPNRHGRGLRSRASCMIGALGALLVGCEVGSPSDDREGDDRWPAGMAWTLDPELTIGRPDGGPQLFGRIADFEVGQDGVIYVLDALAVELRLFSADGAHITTVGGRGQGPGEFSAPVGLAWMPGGDTLLVVDGAGGRYSLFGRDGSLGRTVRRPIADFSGSFKGGFSAGLLYDQTLLFTEDGDIRYGLVGIDLADVSAAHDTVQLPGPGPLEEEYFSALSPTGGMNMPVPFAPSATWQLQGDGSMWWGLGDSYRAYRISLSGDTLARVSAGAEPVPVGPEEIAAWSATPAVTRFREDYGQQIDFDRVPAYKPAFSMLFEDSQGVLWVQVPTIDGLVAFDVFGPNGDRLGRLSTPLTRTSHVRPRVRGDRLYLVGQDDYEVESIQVFRISGRGRE